MLHPLGDRVLIKPELPRTMTDSGLHLIEHWPTETMGEVVAVGTQTSPFRREAHDLAAKLERFYRGIEMVADAATMLRDLTPEIALKVGDTVLFSDDAGQTLVVDGETLLMMRVSDVLCVVDLEAVA